MDLQDQARQQYNRLYGGTDYYWAVEPSKVCFDILKLLPPTRPLKVLDIGCGEGRNSVFFARNGYEVHAFDVSEKGVEKTKTLARQANVSVRAFTADLNTYRLDEHYDIMFSTGVLHCLMPEVRGEVFDNYKQHTNANGLNVFSVFVRKPFVAKAPDADPNATEWRSGELLGKYYDWEIKWSIEEIYNCMSSGIPHRHCVNRVIAKRTES